MKFSEKYELLESVTKGPVKTFLGREVANKTRVVVHIFDCPGNHSGQMAGQWVLQAFRNLAPRPLGQVLEVGSYEETSYAYIVTRMPDAAALQAWVRAYRVHCGSTEDISRDNKGSDITTGSLDVQDIREALAQALPQAPPALDAPQAPGEFTKAFWDLAGKPAEHTDSAKSASTAPPLSPPSIIAPLATASNPVEETRPRLPAGPVGTTGIASSQQPVGSSEDGFTEAFMKLGEGNLSPSSNRSLDSGSIAGIPARMPSAGTAAESPRTQPISQRSTRPEPGAFTKEFLSVLEPDPKPAEPTEHVIQEVHQDIPKQHSPGAFTREFLMATEGSQQGSSEISPSAAKGPLTSSLPTPAESTLEERSPGGAGFTDLFQAAESKRPTPDAARNKAATGEFTSFFGGPFQAPVESQVPDSFPDPLQSIPQKQEAGDFTRMFGPLKSEKEKPESLPGSGGLTPSRLEKEEHVAPALERAEPPPATGFGVLSFARKSVMASPDVAQGHAEQWGGSTFPKPSEMPGKEPIFPPGEATVARRPGPAGATQVFVPRGSGAESIPPLEKSGPGEFTRIISGGAPAQNLPAEAPIGAPSAEPRRFSMTPPQMPPIQAPQMPAIASPQMPAFSMPQIPPPQAPPLPKAQAPSAGKMSYLPLIIIFNVLFVAAVLVVLYFAFKH